MRHGLDPHTAKHNPVYSGRTYYFCSAGCREKVTASPEKYLSATQLRTEVVAADTIYTCYTCPMHPQIRQVGPGFCPICGMALEPVEAGAESGPSAELVDMTRRFWIGLALTIPRRRA